MKKFLKNLWEILKESKRGFQRGEPIVFSAAIAFFTIFSLPAILLILMLAGSTFFSAETAREKIVKEVENLISTDAGEQVRTILENAVDVPAGFWGVAIAVLIVIQSASIIFFIIQKALNEVWQVRIKPGTGFFKILKHKLTALLMVAALGLLFAISLLFDTVVAIFSDQLKTVLEEYFTTTVQTVNTVFYLSIVFVFFTTILRVLPDVKVSWKDALVGGAITSVLFLVGKQIINFALSRMIIAGIYAAAGSLVLLLLWVFYSSIILILGAEVTKAYANNRGRKVKPKAIATKYSL